MFYRFYISLIVVLCTVLSVQETGSTTLPTVRVAVLKFGTVNWLLDTVKYHNLDEKAGVTLEIVPLANKAATAIAFQSGDVDMLVTDWIWAMRQQAKNKAMRFYPYSNSLGALVGRDIANICDLRNKTIGVAGGASDKSWLILQALASRDCGFDLLDEADVLYGAPPLMNRQLEDGKVAAVSTFWHFVARLEAKGLTPVVRIRDATVMLGIDPVPPLIGFVWDTDRIDAPAEMLMRAITDASAILARNDTAWDRLRPLMRVRTMNEFTALRDAYRIGIPTTWTDEQTKSAKKLYDLLIANAGKVFSDQAGPFNSRIFPKN